MNETTIPQENKESKKLGWFVIAILIAAIGYTIFASGCATTGSMDPLVLQKDVRVAARAGARTALQADPNSRKYLELVYGVFNFGTQQGGNWYHSPDDLREDIQALSVKELQDPAIAQGIVDAIEIFANHYPELRVKFGENSPQVDAVIIGLRDGIGDALGYNTTTPPPLPTAK